MELEILEIECVWDENDGIWRMHFNLQADNDDLSFFYFLFVHQTKYLLTLTKCVKN